MTTPTIRQQVNNSANSGAPTGTLALTPTVGNLLVAFITLAATAISGYTVNASKWTQFASSDNGTDVYVIGLYHYVVGGDTATLPTVFSAGSVAWKIVCYEIQGVAGTWASDFQGDKTGYVSSTPTTSFTTTTETTIGANVLGFLCVDCGNIVVGSTLGGSWGGNNGLAPSVGLYANGAADTVILNAGASAFNMSVPSGFSAWDTTGGTTWDPSQCGANITLSSGNLTASKASGAAWQSVRTNTSHASGKYYFEIFVSAASGAFFQMYGMSNANLATNNFPGGDNNSFGYQNGGGTTQKLSPGGWQNIAGASSIYVAIAVDITNGLVWARTSSSTNWNNNGSANPATGVGGFTFASLVFGANDQSYNTNSDAIIIGSNIFPTAGTNVASTVTFSASTNGFGWIQALFGQSAVNVSVTESGSASDTVSEIYYLFASLSEAGSATDTDAATGIGSIAEYGSAIDVCRVALILTASIAEAELAVDIVSQHYTINLAITEAGSASDAALDRSAQVTTIENQKQVGITG